VVPQPARFDDVVASRFRRETVGAHMARKQKKNPKVKTNRAAAKRFSTTGTGLVVFGAKGHRHGLSNKSRKHNRNLKKVRYMSKGDAQRVARQIPYL
jgi:large subunit ribosomal protein L35